MKKNGPFFLFFAPSFLLMYRLVAEVKTLKLHYNMTITNPITIPQDIQFAPYDVTVSHIIFRLHFMFKKVTEQLINLHLHSLYNCNGHTLLNFSCLRFLGTRHTHAFGSCDHEAACILSNINVHNPAAIQTRKSVFTIKTIFQGTSSTNKGT